MNCKHCNLPLNQSVYSKDKTKKSCPKCSSKNGVYHVFYSYPQSFGITNLRSTPNHPEGPQSYCTPCRGVKPNNETKFYCNEL